MRNATVSLPGVAVARAPHPGSVRWSAVVVVAAVGIGAVTAWKPLAGVGLVLAIALGLLVALRRGTILAVLIATVSIEALSIGDVRVTRIVAPVTLLVILAAATRKDWDIRPAAPLVWACGYAIWALASGLWTVSPSGTVQLLGSLSIALVFMVAFASFLNNRRDLDRVLYTFAVCAALIGTSSILAFIDHPVPGLGGAELEGSRVQGGIGDPSFFSAFQLIALPLVLVLAAHAERRWLRYALYLAAIIGIGSVLSSVSRGGFLQLVVVLLLLSFWPARKIFRSQTQKTLALLLIVLGGVAFFARYSLDIAPRLETIVTQGSGGNEDTGSGRLIIWPAAVDAFEERPLLGIGYGSFFNVSVDRMYDTPNPGIGSFQIVPQEVHNTFLGAATELGAPGFALFLGLLVSTGVALRRTARRAQQTGALFVGRIANALIVGLIGWCVGATFISAETSRPLWIIIGMSLALPKLLLKRDQSSSPAQT